MSAIPADAQRALDEIRAVGGDELVRHDFPRAGDADAHFGRRLSSNCGVGDIDSQNDAEDTGGFDCGGQVARGSGRLQKRVHSFALAV